MNTIRFATTNPDKLQIARAACGKFNIDIQPASLEIDEIQGEDPRPIVRNKAAQAFKQLGTPVVVTDDSWDIQALNGFPGAYMKSMNYWFKPEDFLRLMHGVEDRTITVHQFLAYTDGNITKIFSNDLKRQIINEVRGRNEKSPSKTVIALDADGGKTLAEVAEQGPNGYQERSKNSPDV